MRLPESSTLLPGERRSAAPGSARPRALPTWLVLGLSLLLLAGLSMAAEPEPAAPGQLERLARDWLQPALDESLPRDSDSPLRAEVSVGSLDSRLRLAPCARVEPHLPQGTRLWGRSRIGLRCVEGPTRWNVYLPVTVKAFGPAWVIRRPVSAGTVLTQEDAEMAETDWAEQQASVLVRPALWIGQQAAYALQPGQALRQNMVRPVPAFGAGAQVRVRSGGPGFQIVVTGEALNAGLPGQPTRVRLTSGKIVSGLVSEGPVVDVGL